MVYEKKTPPFSNPKLKPSDIIYFWLTKAYLKYGPPSCHTPIELKWTGSLDSRRRKGRRAKNQLAVCFQLDLEKRSLLENF